MCVCVCVFVKEKKNVKYVEREEEPGFEND